RSLLSLMPNEITVVPIRNRNSSIAIKDRDLNLNYFFSIMRDENERLYSFEIGNWNIDYINKKELANAGFFYLMNNDRVQCAFCRGVICEWEPGDNPIEEHKKHYPRCPFILGYNVGNVPIDEDPIKGSSDLRGEDVVGNSCEKYSEFLSLNEIFSKIFHLPNLKVVNLDDYNIYLYKKAANPNYTSLTARINSISQNNSLLGNYDIKEIAEAGFYFASLYKCFRCFHCDGSIYNWKLSNNPWLEHAIRFPQCIYVIVMKGPSFLKSCKETYYKDMIADSIRREQTIEDLTINQWMRSEVVCRFKSLIDCPIEVLEAVLRIRWNRNHIPYKSSQDLNMDVFSYLNSINNETNELENDETKSFVNAAAVDANADDESKTNTNVNFLKECAKRSKVNEKSILEQQ
ncbi:Baculoviral IAP repeat-containing protein 2-like protein, partial [Dinothrombium tinctorium]